MKHFSKIEARDIAISALVLTVAISNFDPVRLAIISLPLTVGFVLHELSHKFAALRCGYPAAYRMWIPGLALALAIGIVSRGNVLIAAPGATIIVAPFITSREMGPIGLAGPVMNLFLAGCFYAVSFLPGLVGTVGQFGALINLWLGIFNMIPVGPLDGRKILLWNRRVWILFTLLMLVLFVLLSLF
jgi:Zn-dependent protease